MKPCNNSPGSIGAIYSLEGGCIANLGSIDSSRDEHYKTKAEYLDSKRP